MTWRPSALQIGLLAFAGIATVTSWTSMMMYGYGIRAVQSRPLGRFPAITLQAAPVEVRLGDRRAPDAVVDHLCRLGFIKVASGEPLTFTHDSPQKLHFFLGDREVSIQWDAGVVSAILVEGVARRSVLLDGETILRRDAGNHALLSQNDRPLAYFQSSPLIDALLASEDTAFWRHQGIDLKRLPFVWWFGGGASTLTQQVARTNVLLDRERTVSRKLREIGTAMALERAYGKPAVLRAYLNGAYLGSLNGWQIRGFQSASEHLLGQPDARALTVNQAATLVALLNRPQVYLTDWSAGHTMRLQRQRNRVLLRMSEAAPDRYPRAVVDALSLEPVQLSPVTPDPELWRGSRHYLDDLGSQPTAAPDEVSTTLVAEWQRAAIDAVTTGIARLERQLHVKTGTLEAALVAIDPDSGDVVAMVGSARSYDESQFNRATQARRPAGSLVKPFVYLVALRDGPWTSASLVEDRPLSVTIGKTHWTPANYSGVYSGWITVTQALARSSNVAAVRIGERVGFDRVADEWSRAIGRPAARHPALVLGATDVSPLEVARAYRTFARPGPGHGPEAAVREMLKEVVRSGTGSAARTTALPFELAGKTGTTNDGRDAWFVGFAPQGPVVAVWVGRDDNGSIGLTGAQAALPIWMAFMKEVLTVFPVTSAAR